MATTSKKPSRRKLIIELELIRFYSLLVVN